MFAPVSLLPVVDVLLYGFVVDIGDGVFIEDEPVPGLDIAPGVIFGLGVLQSVLAIELDIDELLLLELGDGHGLAEVDPEVV